jgi:hypothetical protein
MAFELKLVTSTHSPPPPSLKGKFGISNHAALPWLKVRCGRLKLTDVLALPEVNGLARKDCVVVWHEVV